jgi:hypothetical protein
MKKARQSVKELTVRNRNGVKDAWVPISDLNPILQGCGNYYRTGNAARKVNQLDSYVWLRQRSFMHKRKAPTSTPRRGRAVDAGMVLGSRPASTARHRSLSGGSVTMRRRPSVSRVRDNRMHGVHREALRRLPDTAGRNSEEVLGPTGGREMNGRPTSRSIRTAKTNAGSPTGREPHGGGVPIVVVGVTSHQGGRESRPQGEGAQVVRLSSAARYA